MFRVLIWGMLILCSSAGIAPGLPAAAAQATAEVTPKLTRQGSNYVVTIPGVKWTMQFPASDLAILTIKERPRWGYFFLVDQSFVRLLEATEKKAGVEAASKEFEAKAKRILNVAFWVDDAAKCSNDARIGRDNLWAEMKAKYPVQNPRLSQMGQWYLLEFILPIPKSLTKTYNFYAHYVRDGIWIDFHLSRSYSGEQDRQLFVNFINSVRFEPAEK
jgi:hypothetical protein